MSLSNKVRWTAPSVFVVCVLIYVGIPLPLRADEAAVKAKVAAVAPEIELPILTAADNSSTFKLADLKGISGAVLVFGSYT